MRQLITPNPDIWCAPGWCLMYVRQTFGLPAQYPTATAAWRASTSKHRDRDFPRGCWVPVWFELHNEPAGHVALLAPDGSVYSTSDLDNTPHHHPNLAHLMAFYARYDMPLTYLGWTEDVAGYPVLAPDLALQGSITTPEDEMSQTDIDRIYEFTTTRIAQAQESIEKTVKDELAKIPLAVWSYKNPELGDADAYQQLRDAPTAIGRLTERVAEAAAAATEAPDQEAIKDAVKAAVKELLQAGAQK